MMRDVVVLFDIDGTLISTGGAGRRALGRAFGECFDAPGAFEGNLDFGGKTDGIILSEAFSRIARDAESVDRDALIACYLDALRDEVARSPRYTVHPHARASVEAARAVAGAVGLGTGNIEPAARIKLARAGLDELFDFGGFGDDAHARQDVIEAGFRRGEAKLGAAPGASRRLVIGDTPRDVYAAHALGARCIGVTTGSADEAQLAEAGADLVVDDLGEIVDAMERCLG